MKDISIKSNLYVYNMPEQTVFVDIENPAQIEIVKSNQSNDKYYPGLKRASDEEKEKLIRELILNR